MSVFDKTTTTKAFENRGMTSPLTTIPNVGPAVARQLERLNIALPDDLRGRDPHELFDCLCELDGRSHDPCLLDTLVAAVSYAEGTPVRPWWELSRERKGARAWLSAELTRSRTTAPNDDTLLAQTDAERNRTRDLSVLNFPCHRRWAARRR